MEFLWKLIVNVKIIVYLNLNLKMKRRITDNIAMIFLYDWQHSAGKQNKITCEYITVFILIYFNPVKN